MLIKDIKKQHPSIDNEKATRLLEEIYSRLDDTDEDDGDRVFELECYISSLDAYVENNDREFEDEAVIAWSKGEKTHLNDFILGH